MRSGVLSLIVLSCCTICSASIQTYDVIPLGAIDGQNVIPKAINDAGQVVGTAGVGSGNERAFFWERGRLIPLLGPNPGEPTVANDINAAGLIVGRATNHAVIWAGPGPATEVAPGELVAVNDSGQAVGYREATRFRPTAFYVNGRQRPSAIKPPLSIDTFVTAMNNRGTVVGNYQCDVQFETGAFVWNAGEFETVRYCREPFGLRHADINDFGQYVAWNGRNEAGYIIEPDGDAAFLGPENEPLGLNNLGEVVGVCPVDNGDETHGFYWVEGEFADLNDLILPGRWVVTSAIDVNDFGVIIATGQFEGSDEEQGLLLVPNAISYRLGLGDLPTVAGRPTEFLLAGATPGADQYFFFSVEGEGETRLRFLDITLGLKRPNLLGVVEAGRDGRVRMIVPLPRFMRGEDAYFQVAEFRGVTNIVEASID